MIKFKDSIEKMGEKPILTALILLILLGTLVVGSTLIRGNNYKGEFLNNILVEAHGLLFDIIVFGILIVFFYRMGERRRDINRWKEEIDDYRRWDEKEATYRIVGNIKRLNRENITEIDLSYCFLRDAKLGKAPQDLVDYTEALLDYSAIKERSKGRLVIVEEAKEKEWIADLRGSNLTRTNFCNANLFMVDFRDAKLYHADLRGADLFWAKLQNANLRRADLRNASMPEAELHGALFIEADLRGVRYLTISQLCKSKSLYKAKLDPELLAIVKEKCPKLFEQPKNLVEADGGQNRDITESCGFDKEKSVPLTVLYK